MCLLSAIFRCIPFSSLCLCYCQQIRACRTSDSYTIYYSILYYTILYYIILDYTVVYYTILYSAILEILYYALVDYTIPEKHQAPPRTTSGSAWYSIRHSIQTHGLMHYNIGTYSTLEYIGAIFLCSRFSPLCLCCWQEIRACRSVFHFPHFAFAVVSRFERVAHREIDVGHRPQIEMHMFVYICLVCMTEKL